MEFLDEDAKPRFLFQSGAAAPPSAAESNSFNKPTKPLLFLSLSLSSLFLALSIFLFQSEPLRSILIWLSLSLLLGPFAPPSLTAGDIRVGRGHILHFPDPDSAADSDDVSTRKTSQRRSKSRRSDDVPAPVVVAPEGQADKIPADRKENGNGVEPVKEVKEWTEEDVEILKKQMTKHPAGKPGRWEAIAAAFGGRHGAESVIRKSKELAEKVDDSDSYVQFLKKRKPVDKRVEMEGDPVGGGESAWNSGEDIALLSALKAFPKDVPMRWEKVAAAVPGKSKAACMKRVTELKKGFRSAKAATDA